MTAEFSSEQERLGAWLSTMWFELEVEFPSDLPDDFHYEFDRDSLAELERFLLEEFGSDEEIHQDESKEFLDRTARYIGETLKKSFGGVWQPGSGMYEGMPVVVFPDGTSFPESPFHLVDRVLLRRTGGELARVFDGLREITGDSAAPSGEES